MYNFLRRIVSDMNESRNLKLKPYLKPYKINIFLPISTNVEHAEFFSQPESSILWLLTLT
jgi:hypothetical protein